MDWHERVRRALTKPSGGMISGVSPTVYRKWYRAVHLARPLLRYPWEMSTQHIQHLARNNTRDEVLRLSEYYTCRHFPCAYWSEHAATCPEHGREFILVRNNREGRREHEQAGPEFLVE